MMRYCGTIVYPNYSKGRFVIVWAMPLGTKHWMTLQIPGSKN